MQRDLEPVTVLAAHEVAHGHAPQVEVCGDSDSGKTGWFDQRPGRDGAPVDHHAIVRGGRVVDHWEGE
jgi:hypothetical protein